MSHLDLQNFCQDPTSENFNKIKPEIQSLLSYLANWCIENTKGDQELARAITKLSIVDYKGLYLTTEARKTLLKNINYYFKGISELPGKQCINGASESLLKYMKPEKFIGKGTFGNVYIGCTPVSDCKYRFAIKLATVDKNTIKTPYNRVNRYWHEYFILHDIVKTIIDKKICPNLPYLINTFSCEECNFTFFGYKQRWLDEKAIAKGPTEYKQKKPCLIFIMELATGNDFNTWMQKPHTEAELYNALFQLMAGIHAIQVHGQVINNDVKALNILTYDVKPGGYWKYTIQGKDYFIPNLGSLFIVNDFGVSSVSSPDFCLKSKASSTCISIGPRILILDGKYSILESKVRQLYDDKCKIFKAMPYRNYIGIPIDPPKAKKPTYEVYKNHNCQILKVTNMAETIHRVSVECPKNATKPTKVLPTGYVLTEFQKQKLQQYGIVTNPDALDFYRHPNIICNASGLRTDTQDCIRIFTGGNRYSQPGQHPVFECVTETMKTNLSKYLINQNEAHSGLLGASILCDNNFISPEYDLAGYFINHFFPKYYPDFTKKPSGDQIEAFHISDKLPWN